MFLKQTKKYEIKDFCLFHYYFFIQRIHIHSLINETDIK